MTDLEVELRPSVEGSIKEWLVKSGDTVTKDQVVIRLSVTLQRAALDQATAELKAHEASLKQMFSSQELQQAQLKEQVYQAQRSLTLTQSRLDRMTSANTSTGVYSAKEIESAQLQVELSQSRLKELQIPRDPLQESQMEVIRERIEASRKNVALREAELAMREIHTPLAGTIYFNRFEPGEVVKPEHVLGQVFDRGRWIVKLKVPERQIKHIDAGQSVKIDLAAYSALRDGYLDAQISRILPVVTPRATGDGIFYVEAAIPAQGEFKLEPGMAAAAHISAGNTNWLYRLIGW